MKKRNKIIISIIVVGAICLGGIAGFMFLKQNDKQNERVGYHTNLLGDRVYIFSEEDDPEEVQKIVDEIYQKQESNQFGDDRYAICFMPGKYQDIKVNVGFYTQLAGLGMQSPDDTLIGGVNTQARWLDPSSDNHNATCNFWRSVENLHVPDNVTFAVSQATDMRRMHIDGSLYLHDEYGWASGGFLSDSQIEKMVDSGSQQQWLSMNNQYKIWMGENWNIVFLGDEESGLPRGTWPLYSYTKVQAQENVGEKPFLVYDEQKGYGVAVPKVLKHTPMSWSETDFVSLDDFYVAKPTDTAADINKGLENKKHLLLTPGVYQIDETIKISGENRIILGLGLATLRSQNGVTIMETKDAPGMIMAGVLFDAGTTESEHLLVVGENGKDAAAVQLYDLYFRIGGIATDQPCKAKNAVTIDADDVTGQNFWVWRADHGDQVYWEGNTAANGITVNGDRVRLYGLMVEHFQEYQTIWNGEDGQIIMYQSEIPYDVPSQDVWKTPEGTDGYASIYVNPDVERFEGIGIGIYLYNRDRSVNLHSAMVMPDKKDVSVEHIITVMLNGNPGMEHVLNDAGNPVMTTGAEAYILNYCNGDWK